MQFDRYTVIARLFPAMLGALPFFVVSYFLLTPKVGDFVQFVNAYVWVGNATVAIAATFLLMQVGRWVSKPVFEDRLFKSGDEFPTTSYLLHSDQFYSADKTQQVHQKIQDDFGITLSNNEEEAVDVNEARRKIKDAVALIRNRVGKNGLVSQHNIEYGFARNAAGISVIAALMSGFNMFTFSFLTPDNSALTISAVLFVVYFVYALCASKIMLRLASDYADVLINQYLESRNG